MSESAMRTRVIGMLKHLDAVAVENPACPGTPDVNFIEGWVELKNMRRWPKHPSAVLLVSHFTPQQRIWLRRRHRKNGNVWLLLQVGREWLLLRGDVAAEHLGSCTRQQLIDRSTLFWAHGIIQEEFVACLTLKR